MCGVDARALVTRGTPGNLSAFVNPPPDYVLQYNYNSLFAGTRTNVATDTNGAIVCASGYNHIMARSLLK